VVYVCDVESHRAGEWMSLEDIVGGGGGGRIERSGAGPARKRFRWLRRRQRYREIFAANSFVIRRSRFQSKAEDGQA
jgi:hypothetical protein